MGNRRTILGSSLRAFLATTKLPTKPDSMQQYASYDNDSMYL